MKPLLLFLSAVIPAGVMFYRAAILGETPDPAWALALLLWVLFVKFIFNRNAYLP